MWLGNAVTSSTLLAGPPSNETIDVFYINKINVNCVSHTVVENLKQSLEITYNKRL